MESKPITVDAQGYRDKIATVDKKGKRIWIYPKKPKGPYYNARSYVSWVLMAILFGLPFIKVNGEPLVLFNILERDFILFGIHFLPQDFHLFVLAMLTLVVFIVLFTVVYGRLFCGWVCPQTIFMEMLFRKIEYWIEGDANAQRRLNKAPWTADKIRKKVLKQFLFILISIVIAHTFLSYIIGVEEVSKIVSQSPLNNITGFSAMILFTGAFYFVFSSLREQVCTTICPYGRLQGVMTDQNTILVSYDFVRGEPRGKIRKQRPTRKKGNSEGDLVTQIANKATSESAMIRTAGASKPLDIKGDCIDCKLCVHVCPTGIDIRDGVQLECVNCTACMDVCDEVMEKVGRKKGLIRYDSHNGILDQRRKIFTPRVIAYTAVLIVLVLINIVLLSNRNGIESIILRTPGMLYQEVEEDYISNLYNYQIFNKTGEEMDLEFQLKTSNGRIKMIGDTPSVRPSEMAKGAFFIELERDLLKSGKNKITIEVFNEGQKIDQVKTSFLGPIK